MLSPFQEGFPDSLISLPLEEALPGELVNMLGGGKNLVALFTPDLLLSTLSKVEEQLAEIRGEIGALRRGLEAAASAQTQTSMQSAWSREPTSQGLAERIQKSLGVKGPGRDEEEGRRIGDLVRNLTNLALAITEDRPDRAAEEDKVESGKEDTDDDESLEKRRLVVSTSEGGVKDLEKR